MGDRNSARKSKSLGRLGVGIRLALRSRQPPMHHSDSATSRSGTQSLPSLSADIKSGFLVFLIALPLSLGIAMASGFPPVAGILTAAVGGIVASLLGSARLTIKGPAAGLIVIALGSVHELGGGDMLLGYKRTLAVGVIAALVQIAFAAFRLATAGIVMAPSVVHGMLAAIGVIIISKQSHVMLGVTPTENEPIALLAELPHSIATANPEIALIGVLSLAILFGLSRVKSKALRMVPGPVVVLVFAVPLGLFFDLDHTHTFTFLSKEVWVGPQFLLRLPGSILDAVAFPDFSAVFSAVSLKYIVMFSLIGTIESTLTVLAIDSLDPAKRSSDLNRDLLALGLGNLVSASIGGLPMISEIVRSKLNVDSGATTSRANFSHGVFLLVFVAFLPGLLCEIPLAALAAMLVFTGTRLASLSEVLHVKRIGIDQLVLFLATLLITLATDLLIGVLVGMMLKIGLHVARGAPIRSMFSTQIEVRHSEDGTRAYISLHKTAIFSNLLPLRRTIAALPDSVEWVIVDLSDVRVVDHTFLSRLNAMSDEWPRMRLKVVGQEHLNPVSDHPFASRRSHA